MVNRLVEGIWYHNDFSITRFSIMIARMITLILARCIITERRLRYNVDNGGQQQRPNAGPSHGFIPLGT